MSSFAVAVPSHHDVRPSAPSQVKLTCTWSACETGPVYGRHPSLIRYVLQIRRFQITYITPRRRALPPTTPRESLPVSQAVIASPAAFCAGTRESTIQSNARPSLCSDVAPIPHPRTIPPLRPCL